MPIGSERSRLADLLGTGAEMLGCPLSDFQIEQFMTYLVELEKWNRRVNLTAITDSEQVIERHFLDSLAGMKAIDRTIDSPNMLDIGTGAGFPALPLKIALPHLRVALVEVSEKKASFLHHITGKLHLKEVMVLNQKLESVITEPTRYDFVVARAFAKKETVLEKALCLLSGRGKLILYRGKIDADIPFRHYKGKAEMISYELPFSKIHRHLEIFYRES